MPGPASPKTPKAAVDRFRRNLGAALSCVTHEPLIASPGPYVAGSTYTLTLEKPVALTAQGGGSAHLWIDVRHTFSIIAPSDERGWTTTTRKYEYSILTNPQEELLVYHWHPKDIIAVEGSIRRIVPYPHVHISGPVNVRTARGDARPVRLDKVHLPTGRTSLESIVRMLLWEKVWNVKPIRNDWERVLAQSERVFLIEHKNRF